MRKTRYILFLGLSYVLSVYSSDCTIYLYNSKPGEIYDDSKGVSLNFQTYNGFEGLEVSAPFKDENTRLNFFNYFSAEGNGCDKCSLNGYSHGKLSNKVKEIGLETNKLFSFPKTCLSKFELSCEAVQEEAVENEETIVELPVEEISEEKPEYEEQQQTKPVEEYYEEELLEETVVVEAEPEEEEGREEQDIPLY